MSLYDSRAWQRRRKTQLQLHPCCTFCRAAGRIEPATVADHVEPWRKAEDPIRSFWTGELQSLCSSCHSAIKQAYERTGHLRGSTLEGLPLDPRHHWFRGVDE